MLGIVFAVLTMAYTGVLLGASKGVPFWRSGVVPVVFVVSALVTGHFTIMLGVAKHLVVCASWPQACILPSVCDL